MMEFLRFIKKGGRSTFLIVIALVGAVLLLISAGGEGEKEVADDRYPSIATKRALEEELEGLILSMEGVSRVKVSVSLESGNEYVYENGKNTLILAGRVRGVAVVCDGGADAVVKGQIVTMLCALFDLPMKAVSVSQ